MVLRLVLVGLVAGLGFSLPTRQDLETLGRSARAWVDETLADRISSPPTEATPFVFAADEARPTPTETETAPTTVATPVQEPAKAPAEVVDVDSDLAELVEAFADETTPAETPDVDLKPLQIAESPTMPEIPTALDAPLLAAPTEPVAEIAESAPAPIDTLAAIDDEYESETEITEITVAETIDPDRDFASVVEQMASAFASDLAVMEAIEAEAEMNALAQTSEPVESIEMSESADLYPGLAYALNLEAEGLNLPASDAPETSADAQHSPTDRLSHAVRLTREAVFAWANLLHGPAVVAISQ
jgi:hypothetical protein